MLVSVAYDRCSRRIASPRVGSTCHNTTAACFNRRISLSAMRIWWSYKSVPELGRLPEWRRREMWERCRRKVPGVVQMVGVVVATASGVLGAAIGRLVAPASLAILGLVSGLSVGLLIGGIVGEQIVLRRARFYLLAELGEHCPRCGYSLAACASGLCPECGSPIVHAAQSRNGLDA